MADLAWQRALTERDTERVRELLLAVRAEDGRPELDERDGLPREFAGGEHLFVSDSSGYTHLDTGGDAFGRSVAELFVRPEARGRGVGALLVTALLDRIGARELRVWAHGDHPAAARLAVGFGFTRARELHRMRRQLADELDEVQLPDGVRIRAFVPGQDEQAVLAVNAAAFSWHPEQGGLSLETLRRTERESWFDPAGFLLAERDGRLLGFHWTKVHQRAAADESGRPMGEVYVIGVEQDAQGGGLGRALTLAGLEYLRAAGLTQVMLYAESDNPGAIALYRKLGFDIWDNDVQYAHRATGDRT
ncbi:MAG: mycothiol synthase [Sciscionella sp.]